MAETPLMPKATAVWLVDNTSLTFEQIADFCGLHPLEVKGIADEDVAKGIKGQDPVTTGQLTREQIEEAEKNPKHAPEDGAAQAQDAAREAEEGAALHARFQAPGQARCGLLDPAQPSRIHRRRHHQADRHHQGDDPENPRALRTGTRPNIKAVDPVTLGLCQQIELDFAVSRAAKRKPSTRAAKKAETLKPAEETTANMPSQGETLTEMPKEEATSENVMHDQEAGHDGGEKQE